MNSRGVRAAYDRTLKSTVPVELHEAVTTAAREKMQSVGSWLRAACLKALKENAEVERR